MVAVDEFELGSSHVPDVARRPAAARRRGDRPSGWFGLAIVTVSLGVLAAPVTLARTSAEIPQWGGLDAVTYVTVDDGVDAVAIARDAVGFFASYDAERRPTGTVVVVLRDVPAAGDQLAPDHHAVVMDAATGALIETTLDRRMFGLLELAAPRSDWVCEPDGAQALCTALADTEITVFLDWPTS